MANRVSRNCDVLVRAVVGQSPRPRNLGPVVLPVELSPTAFVGRREKLALGARTGVDRLKSDVGGEQKGYNFGNMNTYERAHASSVVETAPGIALGQVIQVTPLRRAEFLLCDPKKEPKRVLTDLKIRRDADKEGERLEESTGCAEKIFRRVCRV